MILTTRKIFQHCLVPTHDLGSEIIPDVGRVYTTSTGEKYESVTTRIGKAFPSDWIEEWKARVGEEEANKISGIAVRRGSAVHELAEKYVMNDPNWTQGSMPVNLYSFSSIKSALDLYVDNIRGIELPLYSHTLKTAGRTDLVAEYKDKLSVIDFKTSKKKKSAEDILGYFLQSTCYAMMYEELYGEPVDIIAIIMMVDHEGAQMFKRNNHQFREQVKAIFG
jgi:genome maintenance exonuclease 1